MKKPKKIRYAVVGLGHISQNAMLPGFKNAKSNSELIALVSSDQAKLRKLGKMYKAKLLYGYDEFEELAKSGLIDAVYVATPNTEHLRYAEIAIENGVHVLCEKPLAAQISDAEAMLSLTKKHDVKFMTAYRLHFEAANLAAMKIAHSKTMGDLKIFNSTFTQQVDDAQNYRLEGELGGGPLLDVGVYCINASRYIFRDTPTEVYAIPLTGDKKRFAEVPESVSVMLKYPGDRVANFVVSFGASGHECYDVIGTKGSLRLDNSYGYGEKKTLSVIHKGKTKKTTFAATDQFGAQLLYFSNCILKNKQPEPSAEEGLIDMQIILALQESIKTGKLTSVKTNTKSNYPNERQKISKPMVKIPEDFHATPPVSVN